MATGECLICRLKNITEIPGANNIVQANLFGETIIISKDHKEGELGLLFDIETILDKTFCTENNLFRHSDLNKNKNEIGYFEDNPRVRPIKLRGVKVSAFWIPIKSLDYIKKGIYPKEGTQINEWYKKPICKKYIRPIKQNNIQQYSIKRVQEVFNFVEHLDTDQLLRNLNNLNIDDKFVVSTKIHGTSARCGLLPVTSRNKLKAWWYKLWNKKLPYKMVVGSRHVLKHIEGQKCDKKSSFYYHDIWTDSAYKYFYGKLNKGETIYYEIAGFLPNGTPIMPTSSNEKLKKFLDKNEYKEFIEKYGKETVFSYGCKHNWESDDGFPTKNGINRETYISEYKIFVYRITLTTDAGQSIDLSWEQLKRRCEELGVNHVPELHQDLIHNEEDLKLFRDENFWINMTEQDCKFFPQHINEGICVRIESESLKPHIYKSKRFYFKILEGIIKDNSDFADIEESN